MTYTMIYSVVGVTKSALSTLRSINIISVVFICISRVNLSMLSLEIPNSSHARNLDIYLLYIHILITKRADTIVRSQTL